MLDEGQVRGVRGADLVEVDIALQVVRARVVEGRGGEVHAFGVRVVAQLGELRLAEGVVLLEQVVLRLGRLLGEIPVGRRVLGHDGARLVGLEFRAVAARLGGTVHVALGGLHGRDALGFRRVVEVDAHLGDQVGFGVSHSTISLLPGIYRGRSRGYNALSIAN